MCAQTEPDRTAPNADQAVSIAVIHQQVLQGTVPMVGRLACLAQCSTHDLSKLLSPQAASDALSTVREFVWQDWLRATLMAERADLLAYLRLLPQWN